MKKTLPTKRLHSERALLVGVEIFQSDNLLPLDDSLTELRHLAVTAGFEVVGQVTQKLNHPHPKTFIGSGKAKEVRAMGEELDVAVVLFDNELSPRHQRELEGILEEDVRVLDRTALILDIFAQHASTREGALQVELAQYEYRLPRLTRAWTHLVRQAGGGGGRTGGTAGVGLRGPGETQLETDRREIRRRITHLKAELEKVRAHRKRHRSRRKESRIPTISLVGYTNAGKSTLLNHLAEADVYVADKLFATLDPTTRRVNLPDGSVTLFTDTVGFIQKLPTTLVAAFRATLEEIAEADLLLHVIDITHPQVKAQVEAVHQTLEEIEADHIPLIPVLNKIDRLRKPDAAMQSLQGFPNAVAVSALRGDGMEDLLQTIQERLYEDYQPMHVELPHDQGGLVALFHEDGLIERIENTYQGVTIQGRIPGRHVVKYMPYVVANEDENVYIRPTG
ncbi:MAG: GTPase HflX [Chloroflexi bacterium]|nr:GTPase HflX [Chloroflexota bacterium]